MVHFDLLTLNNGMPGTAWAAVDVLRCLNTVESVRSPRSGEPAVSWRVIDAAGETHPMHASTCIEPLERRQPRRDDRGQRVLLVPPLENRTILGLRRLAKLNTQAVDLIRRHFDDGSIIGACGTGMWLLAQSGCLTEAPVPWLYQSGFARHFPGIRIEPKKNILVAHRVVCAATPSLSHALLLHLAQCAGLADLTHAAAQSLLFDTERQGLAAEMGPDRVGGLSRDVPLYRAQAWLQANASRPLHLKEAAEAAAVSERTLTRLFRQHLDCTPLKYLEDIRIKRAHMWLESTWRSIDEIAHDSGYRDTSAFCRMFTRATGTSPQRYRERLTLRGPRARWRLGETPESPA